MRIYTVWDYAALREGSIVRTCTVSLTLRKILSAIVSHTPQTPPGPCTRGSEELRETEGLYYGFYPNQNCLFSSIAGVSLQ